MWANLQEELESPRLIFRLEDLSSTLPDQAEGAFEVWIKNFCEKVKALPDNEHVLLGYSLGGRLGFHALLECPGLWAGAVIIAADPGLDDAARVKQLAFDQHWAERWRSEAWEALWRDWNASGVFAGRENLMQGAEAEFSRSEIARTFDVFSKGRQKNLRPQLAQLEAPPVLYISGEDDGKYRALGAELAELCPALTHKTVNDAAHRVPWENPQVFMKTLKDFLTQIEV